MSNNLDVIRSLYQAFAVGDIPAVLAALSPNVRLTEAEGGKVVSFHRHTDTAAHLRPMQP